MPKKLKTKKPVAKPLAVMDHTLAVRAFVDFPNNLADCFCIVLGSFGFSNRCIERCTGLVPSQISYRLNKAKINRRDYRDGESLLARAIITRSRETATAQARSLARIMRSATSLDIRAIRGRVILMDRSL